MMISLPKVAAVLAALPWAASAAALPDEPVAQSDIVGGYRVKAGQYPFVVSIIPEGQHDCGGVLVNAMTVMTAAHCTRDEVPLPGNAQVRAGSLDWTTGGTLVDVSQVVVHPKFDYDAGVNDIALLRLSAPIHPSSAISYAALPPAGRDPEVGSNLVAIGWGVTNYKVFKLSEYLRQVTVPVISEETCRARYEPMNVTVVPGEFCAGLKAGGKSVCAGDSGGPLVDPSSKIVWGLVSRTITTDCGEPEDYDLYTSVGKHADWINQNKFY